MAFNNNFRSSMKKYRLQLPETDFYAKQQMKSMTEENKRIIMLK